MTKITQLPSDLLPTLTDYLATVDVETSTTKRVTLADILTLLVQTNNLYNPYKFSVYRNTALSITANTTTIITFDTKEYDTGNNVDIVTNKGRFTATVAGTYSIKAQIGWGGTTANGIYLVSLFKNGTEYKRGNRMQQESAGSDNMYQTINVDVYLNVGDYLTIQGYTNVTNSLEISSFNNYFMGHLISKN